MKITKFRAWDYKKKNMILEMKGIYIFHFSQGFEGIESHAGQRGEFLQASWLGLMQFTGLQDKNGKDIYEGDNIEFEFYNEIRKETVIYGNGSFTLGYCMSLWDTEQDRFKSVKLEIIGNIHENPELTK